MMIDLIDLMFQWLTLQKTDMSVLFFPGFCSRQAPEGSQKTSNPHTAGVEAHGVPPMWWWEWDSFENPTPSNLTWVNNVDIK